MTKLFNNPTNFKEEMIDGYVAAYSRYIERIPNASGVMVAGGPQQGKVSVLVGGGSGHYPTFCGFVGKGCATGAVIGEVFASPSAEQVYRCTKAVDGGVGVLYVVANYNGDVMNFGMAETRCRAEGIDVRTVLVNDDVASEIAEDRRGISGFFFVVKTAGASAVRGDQLADVQAYAQRASSMTRSFGIAFGGCTIRGQSTPLFTVESDKMELGLGIHGEPGIETIDLLSGNEIAKLMVDKILSDTPSGANGKAAVLVNGLGSTKYEELFVLYREIHRLLDKAGVEAYYPVVDEFATSLDMKGCSLSLMWLDHDLQALYDAPAVTPTFTKAEIE